MKKTTLLICLWLWAMAAGAQTFISYIPLDGNNQFAAFDNSVLSSASVFTIEYWIKTTESRTNGTYWQRPTMIGVCTSGNASGDFGITTDNGYVGFWQGLNSSGDLNYQSSTLQINDNNWHHIALVNNGALMTLFVDGNNIASNASGNGIVTINTPVTVGGTSLDFGMAGNNATGINFYHQGQYAEMRVSSTARYTNGFTPATSFTADASTVSLLHFNGQCGVKQADVTTAHNDLVTNNTSASCTTLPFTNSFSFDGSTQYGITPAGLLNGLSVFTIEGWIKTTDLNVTPNSEVWRAPNIVGNSSNGGGSGDFIVTTQGGFLSMYSGLNTSVNDLSLVSKAFIADNQWHHWAASVNGSVAMLFADGVEVGSLPINRALLTSGGDAFGLMVNNSTCCGGPIYKHSGMLDEVRFSTTARYTSSFTPPSGTFTADASTAALYHFDMLDCLSLNTPDASGNNNNMLMYGYAGCQPDVPYPAAPVAVNNVTKAEYFIDVEPGFGNGGNIPITAATDISSLTTAINTASLSPGVHRLYLRTANVDGNWSMTGERDFLVDYNVPYSTAPAAITNVTKAEYFIDTDPGFGMGTTIPLTAANDISGISATIVTGSLLQGIHRVYLRTADASGYWSHTSERDFLIDNNPAYPPAPTAPGNITKLEYFFDTDPGFGNGTTVSLTATTDISGYSFAANTTGLSGGSHTLFIRSFDDWSMTSARAFSVSAPLPVSWLGFTATKQEQAVFLQWKVNDEYAQSYTIERSNDCTAFKAIGEQKAEGNAGIQLYNFTDYPPLVGVSYYRIRRMIANGTSDYSVVLPVRFEAQGNDVHLYPNPASDVVHVKTIQRMEGALSLYAANGQLVWQGRIDGYDAAIPLQNLSGGTYQFSIACEDGTVLTRQIIKQ